jgi:NAD(P)H-quinone oxidoreductase subunit I
MFKLLKQVSNHAKATVQVAQHMGPRMAVTFDPMRRRPMMVQYPLGNTNAD